MIGNNYQTGLGFVADQVKKHADSGKIENENVPDYKVFFEEAFNVLEPNTRLNMNWHVPYLCDELQIIAERIANEEPKEADLIVNMMFRSLKSMIFTVIYNAWLWARWPWWAFVSASYSSTLSNEHGVKTKKLIRSQWYQSHFGDNVQIYKGQDEKSYFMTTEGGERKITSVGGSVIGSGGLILCLDDPVKPPNNNEMGPSETEIKKANAWHDSTWFSRLNNPITNVRMLVMQRISSGDMTQHLLDKAKRGKIKIKHICIPARESDLIKPKELKKFYTNGLFFENRFSHDVLEEFEDALGEYAYAQIDQDPRKDTANKWEEEMFTPISRDAVPDALTLVSGWDLASTKKEKNSASAFVTGGTDGKDLYVINCNYFWKQYHNVIQEIRKERPPHYIENKMSGLDAIPQLQNEGIDAHEYPNTGFDKTAHTNFTIRQARQSFKNIYVVEDIYELLLDDDKQGLLNWGKVPKDDLNDAFCIMVNSISKGMYSASDLKSMTKMNKSINLTPKDSFGAFDTFGYDI